MKFNPDASISGKLIYGHEEGWHWSKNGGHYHRNRDFFWVHWEIGERVPHTVKLHVECPKAAIDLTLNEIKQEMVQAFRTPRFQTLVEKNGFIYKAGSRAKPEHVEQFKCTSPFHVILSKSQSQGTDEANIEMVNAALSEAVRQVIQPFRARLDNHFAE